MRMARERGRSQDGRLAFERVADGETLRAIARLFEAFVDDTYMTVGDFESGRIDDELRWDEGLKERFIEAYALDGGRGELFAVKGRDGLVIGFMGAAIDPLKRYAIIGDFMIDPRFRRAGYGTEAFRWLEGRLKGMGIRRLLIESGIHNTRAQAFFAKMGFREFGIEGIKEI